MKIETIFFWPKLNNISMIFLLPKSIKARLAQDGLAQVEWAQLEKTRWPKSSGPACKPSGFHYVNQGAQTRILVDFGLEPGPQLHEKTPFEGRKNEIVAGEGKKSEILGCRRRRVQEGGTVPKSAASSPDTSLEISQRSPTV